MAPVSKSCSRVGTSKRGSTMPKRPSRVEHLRRRSTRGVCGAGHSGLVLTKLPREADLEQLHDLTGRPDVDVGIGAFADLLPQGSTHRLSSRREEQTPGAAKEPLRSRPPGTMIAFHAAETGAQSDASRFGTGPTELAMRNPVGFLGVYRLGRWVDADLIRGSS